MNYTLQKEILKHIFKRFGVFLNEKEVQTGFIDNLLDDKYLTDKKIGFETEDKKKFSNNIYAATATANTAKLKVLIADIHEDIAEYTIIFQMDNLPAYALRLSFDEDDVGSNFINIKNGSWVESSMSVQAKFLYGIEGLSEIVLQWDKLNDFRDMYQLLIHFLNFYEKG
jgi:hypothetical protein